MPKSSTRTRGWMSKLLSWTGAGLVFLFRLGLVGWGTLAIYWSNLPWSWARLTLAVVFLLFGIWALWFVRKPAAFALAFLVVLSWWWLIPPSDDRDWREEVAVKPRVEIDGDRILIRNVRNFDFRSRDDFTARYEDREVFLSHLVGVDFFLSFWMEGPVGHTWVSFVFDNAPPLSISIETRPEKGEGFDPLASMFKQFELIYVIGDEHDVVGLRTNHRSEETFLYHVVASPEAARRLFLVYLERVNELADGPEWYNLISNNCTLNIVRYMNRAGREGNFRPSHLLNGLFDGYLFNAGFLDTSMSFEELRKRSRITEAAQAAANTENFFQRIRKELPELPSRARRVEQGTAVPPPVDTEGGSTND
jgi:Domain of unknown function (DUF4105)